ncbi:tetratricopeptide repeat protein [Nitratidesulfovibrio termitidis]|uniref:tetratricopeptide repeat protein n=1 Tax=Nitratidesulfovibrio termitidis TaxID=42252 RepID=UPI00040941E8|nr:tetratricopeptide repeat protein [Nitratidesulfovibrio termitidis]
MCAASQIGALNRQGMQALSEGNLANADFLLSQALRQATALGLAGFEAKIRNNLGLVCRLRGRTDEAVSHFSAALAHLEAKVGTQHRVYATIAGNLDATRAEAAARVLH